MENYKFGIKVVADSGGSEPDYIVKKPDGVTASTDYNPYGNKGYFDDTSYMVSAGGQKITSIPSPYARMHLTDIAFREYVSGIDILGIEKLRSKALSDDYVKAMSHCLDMFEIMYRMTDLDLLEHDITIHLNNVVTPSTPGLSEAAEGNPNLRRYIDTLQLFRNAYNKEIRSRVGAGKKYYYDFTSNYLFKYKGITFGATSPFSGFFTKADCNLVNEKDEAVLVFRNHNFLTNRKADWQLFEERDSEFLKFLYLLLNDTGLSSIYKNLYEALKLNVDIKALSNKTFATEFANFNLGPQAGELPQVVTARAGNTYVRPNNIDRCYLKYILYIDKPFDFSIDIEEFKKPIADRLSPDGSKPMAWLSVNDLLSDSLMVLPYEIDDKYAAIKYHDEVTKHDFRRCLIPIKQQALNYIDLESLVNGLSIKRYGKDHFCVILTLELTTGGNIELRRDYYSSSLAKGICSYPNGVIMQGADMKQFVFGVYPFVKSKRFENIYKVLFYNDFQTNWNLKFYYETNDDKNRIEEYPEAQVLKNVTNTVESGGTFYPHNCSYYQVSGGELEESDNHKIGIKFAELSLDIPISGVSGTLQTIKGTALIVPCLPEVGNNDPYNTTIAIDLGTSNTYMAYYHDINNDAQKATICDFTTIHGKGESQFVELEFMHKDADKRKIPTLVDFYQDAILPVQGDSYDEEALSAQLSEFIPARIVRSEDESGSRFPIPSVINKLRTLNENEGMIPLVNRSIPFAYYSIGWRKDEEQDKNIDNISEGTFKWFFGKNKKGKYTTDEEKQNDFVAFMSELLFIVRSNMICNGYDLDKCKIIWTYPLSFQKELVKVYTKQWEINFCKYFHPSWLRPDQTDVLDKKRDEVKKYIKSTNESLTPFFACCEDRGSIHHLNLVIDMGGGSTDIIGYRHNRAKFITSFGFAGNSLYLDGNLNHKNQKRSTNYIDLYVRDALKPTRNQQSTLEHTRKIDLETNIKSLMNYGFSQNQTEFENIFLNPVPKFMLQFHNAALFYHIAQVCQAMVDDEMPVNIYLTGNGSKLITMDSNYDYAKKYLRKAFQKVYGKTDKEADKITVSPYPNPKAATVYGALEGDIDGTLSFNDDARESRVVAFGNDSTFERINREDDGIPTAKIRGRENEVYDNVKKFIDFFYDSYGNHTPIMNKVTMIECLDFIEGDDMNKVAGDFLTDSLFFQYISLLMEQVSLRLINNQ